MAHVSRDGVLQSATANTTVSFTVGAVVAGFQTLATAGVVDNDTLYYSARAVDAGGTPTGAWENGLGTLTGVGATLNRTTILSSSNANAAVTFAGTLRLALTLLAARTPQFDNLQNLRIPLSLGDAPAPASGLTLYAKEIIPGLTVLRQMRPSGDDVTLQDGLASNRFIQHRAGQASIIAIGGAPLTSTGSTLSAVNIASGSAKNATQRVILTSAATAAAVATLFAAAATVAPMFRGGVIGEGGFKFILRFSLNTLVAGNRGFFGLADVAAAPTNVDYLAATAPGRVGIGFSLNTGNFILVNTLTATAPTVLDLGANFPLNTTDLFDFMMFCKPFDTAAGNIGWRLRRYTLNSNTPAFETSGVFGANVPTAVTLLHLHLVMGNNATAAAVAWCLSQLTIESDF